MSRLERERRLEAEERWPLLARIFPCYLHEDYPIIHGSLEAAVDQLVADCGIEQRLAILKELRDWNSKRGWKADIHRFVWEGFRIYYTFDSALEAREFMNTFYDKLIIAVRSETGTRWKP